MFFVFELNDLETTVKLYSLTKGQKSTKSNLG